MVTELRPDEITVQLKKNGEVVETIKLTSADGWKFIKTHVDGDDEWKAVEVVPEGYESEIKYIDNLIQIINTPEPTEPEPTEPEPTEPEPTEPEPTEPESTEPESSGPETSEPETTTPETTTAWVDDEPETTVPPTTVPETSAPALETTPAEPTAPTVTYRGVEIPREVLDRYPGRTLDELFDMGVLGAYFENVPTGLLPATGEPLSGWSILAIISAIGLAILTLFDKKREEA